METGVKYFQRQNQIYQGKRGDLLKIKLGRRDPRKALAHCCPSFAYLQAKDEESDFSKILQIFHFMTVYDLLQGGCAF